MAKKITDAFGKVTAVKVSLTESDRRRLGTHEWFIECLNEDTRNAVAQSLELVNHDGDTIFYYGKMRHGFKTPFDHVIFLHNSTASGTWKFTAYHRVTKNQQWTEWKGGKKSALERLRNNSHLFMRRGESPFKK